MKSNPLRNAIAICAIAFGFLSAPVFAATTNWTDATGNWFTAGNWDNGVPTALLQAFIDNGGTAQIGAPGATASSLLLGTTATESGTLEVGATGTLTLNTFMSVAASGMGTLSITGGGTVSNVDGSIAFNLGSTGLVTVSGTGSKWMNSGDLTVGNQGTATLNILSGGAVTSVTGTIGTNASAISTVTVDGTGSKWTNSGTLTVGLSGDGTLSITNGGTASNTIGSIATSAGSVGTVTVDGAGSMWTNSNNLFVGGEGDATLNITTGGLVSNTNGIIATGTGAGAMGTANVDGAGSMWSNSGYLLIGNTGTGAMNVTNGGSVSNTDGTIAKEMGSTGTVTVDGTGSTWTNSGHVFVGDSGTGTLNIQNGGAVSDTFSNIGRFTGSTGTATVDGVGSTWTNSSFLTVGFLGTGILHITNGGAVSDTSGDVGAELSSSGTATVDGAGSTWTNSSFLIVGELGNGTLTITNGGKVSDSVDGTIGAASTATGTVTVDGAGSTWTNSGIVVVSDGGRGTLNITNGGVVSNTDGFIGGNPASIGSFTSSIGTVTVDGPGSTWTNSGNLTIGQRGTGTLNITNGGTVSNTDGTVADAAGSTGTVIVDGIGSTWTNSGNLFVGGNAGGPGGTGLLHVTNSGTVSALTTTIWSGGTVIDDASLVSPTVSVMTGGLLGGTGTVFGDVTNSGIVSPGDSPGTLTFTGNYTQNSGGTLKIEIGGLNSGVNSDLLNVNGAGGASLNGTLQLARINNFMPMIGNRVTIINDGSGHTGTFSNLDLVNWGLIQPVPMYNEPTDVYVVFELASTFQSQGETPNQRAVGHAIDQAFSDQCLASNVLGFLGTIPVSDLPRVFDLIAPEELAAMYEISFSRAVVQSANLQGRMDQIRDNADPNCGPIVDTNPPIQESKNVVGKNVAPAPAPDSRWGTFAMGSGGYVTVHNQDDNAEGYKITNGSFLAGVDYRLLHNLAIGVYGGYVGSESDLVGRGRITADGGTVGGYATFFCHGFYLQGAGGGGWNGYENRRDALLGQAHGSTNGSEVNATGAIGYDWSMNFNAANHPGSLTVGPIASVQYTNVDIDRYSESGSLIPLEIQGQSEDSLRSTIGGKAEICIQTDHGVMLRPEVRVAWLHEYNDRSYPIDARFIGCPTIFTVHGPVIGADAAQVNAGVTIQFNPMVALYAHYDGLFGRDNYDSNSVSGGLAISF